MIGYNLDPDFDIYFFKEIGDINPEDIFKITHKYLSKPFLSISGNKKICNEIYQLWIKNF